MIEELIKNARLSSSGRKLLTSQQKPWMAGVFFWKWYPEAHGRDPDFTPQGKAAEAVMAEYFLRG
jgi:hypothetical protein